MSMPKGYVSENGYGTVKSLGGITYHKVAELMNEQGYKMNHSTARNVYVNSLIKIAKSIVTLYGLKLTDADIKKIAINPNFQESISHFMKEYLYEKK